MADDSRLCGVIHRRSFHRFGRKRETAGLNDVQISVETDGKSHQSAQILRNIRLKGDDMHEYTDLREGGSGVRSQICCVVTSDRRKQGPSLSAKAMGGSPFASQNASRGAGL